MSGDPEQEYFSDGITEDIITDLSQISAIFVVARNTAFNFKGKTVEIDKLARQLQVGYVLKGSVRKAGNRIRITAQLVDAATGGHLWAKRFDRVFADIFALQDEISRNVVDALKLKLLPEELKAIRTRSTSNAQAYKFYLQARARLAVSWGTQAISAVCATTVHQGRQGRSGLRPRLCRHRGLRCLPLGQWGSGGLLRRHADQQQQGPRAGAEPGRGPCVARRGALRRRSSRAGDRRFRAGHRAGFGALRSPLLLRLQLPGDRRLPQRRPSLRASGGASARETISRSRSCRTSTSRWGNRTEAPQPPAAP